jgi:hypothetical protein
MYVCMLSVCVYVCVFVCVCMSGEKSAVEGKRQAMCVFPSLLCWKPSSSVLSVCTSTACTGMKG